MSDRVHRIRSELPGGDPALLNRLAWARRWADRQTSLDHARNALTTAKAGKGRRSRSEQGLALRTLAWHARWRGENEAAMNHCLNAETLLTESRHPQARARIYSTLGLVHLNYFRVDLANSSLDRGLWLLRETPEADVSNIIADLLLVRANVQRVSGERARAGITLARASEMATGEMETCIESMLSQWLLDDDDVDAARERAEAAIKVAIAQDNQVLLPYLHSVLGGCDAHESRPDAAIEHFRQGMTRALDGKDNRVLCFLLSRQATMETDRGNDEDAVKLFKEAAVLAKAKKFALAQKCIALDLAHLFERMGKYKQSVDQHKLAWRLQNEARVR